MRLDPSYYGYIIKGGIGSPLDWDDKKQVRDIARVCKEIPMDVFARTNIQNGIGQ